MKKILALVLALTLSVSCLALPVSAAAHPFSDVGAGDWYEDPVVYCYTNGLINGTSSTTFGPEINMNRGMLVTVLYRMEGSPEASGPFPFTDVAGDAYYRNAVHWAYVSGVVNGTSATAFSPENGITREQMVTIFYRYAKNKGLDTSARADLTHYRDDIQISQFAEEAFRWAAAEGLINGVSSSELAPQGLATRAQCAAMLMRLDKLLGAEEVPEESKPVESKPVESKPVESEPVESDPVESDPVEGEGPGAGSVTQVDPVEIGGDYHWRFEVTLVNDTETPLKLQQLEIVRWKGGLDSELVDEWAFPEERLPDIFLGGENGSLELAPGEAYFWEDWHPVVDWFDSARYIFTFRDASGQAVVYGFSYELSHELPEKVYPSYADDDGRDLETLRYEADFCVNVAEGVDWVPARALGDSDYTNAEIQALLTDTPEEKQEEIDTLYEALQLYQIGAFSASDDNIRIWENGVNWEHHKPGYDAVRTNTGCCATDSNWLRYILNGDYDEVGYLATSQRDGSGHIYNYIKEDGWYYFIDLTHYRTDWIATAVESGSLEDYYRSDFVLGNIHRVRDVQDYVNYVQNTFTDPPGLMFFYTAENCLAVDGVISEHEITITYETVNGVPVEVVFDDPSDHLNYAFVPSPTGLPDWSATKSFDFSVIG